MTVIKREYVHFSLGDGMGQLYTEMVREKCWYNTKRSEAILMLIRVMPEMTCEQAEAILDGKMKLVTNKDGIRLNMVKDNWIPPDTKKMKELIVDVLGWCSDVFTSEDKKDKLTWFKMLPTEQRVSIEMEASHIRDLMEFDLFKAHNLAKNLKMVAIECMIENSERFKSRVKRTEYLNTSLQILQKKFDMLEKEKEFVAKTYEAKRHEAVSSKVEPDNYRLPSGWLSPNGDWYSGEYAEHKRTADQIAEDNGWGDDGESALEERGWIKVGLYMFGDGFHEVMFHPDRNSEVWRKGPTEQQKKALKECLEKHKIKKFKYSYRGPYTFNEWLGVLSEERER